MPDLEFREEEPVRASCSIPNIQERLLQAAIEGTPSEARVVRFAEWREGTGKPFSRFGFTMPVWLFGLGTFAVGLAFFALSCNDLGLLGASTSIHKLGKPYFNLIALSYLVFMPGVLLHLVTDRMRLRRRLPTERQQGETGVTAVFAQRGIVFAEDQGYLRYEGGSLFFEGLQTSFSISKYRLALRPRIVGFGDFIRSEAISPRCPIRLTYEQDGIPYELGIFPLTMLDDPRFEFNRFQRWMAAPGDAPVVQVLPPRTMPPNAKTEALRTMAWPILVGEALAVLAALGLHVYLSATRVSGSLSRLPHALTAPGFDWFDILTIFSIGFEVLAFGYLFCLRPLRRAIRRYRFVKRHS